MIGLRLSSIKHYFLEESRFKAGLVWSLAAFLLSEFFNVLESPLSRVMYSLS